MDHNDREQFWKTLCSLPGNDIVAEREQLFKSIKYPKLLFRYRPVSTKSLEALRTNKLYFSSANYYDDTFEITETGLSFSNSEEGIKRNEILEEAILSYPPAVRILNLLEDGIEKTKFELGQKLGFVGEDGFTSLPQDILIMTLANEEDTKEKNKLRTDTEGSSDKYARMIAKWLTKLDIVKQVTKQVTVQIGANTYTENLLSNNLFPIFKENKAVPIPDKTLTIRNASSAAISAEVKTLNSLMSAAPIREGR